MSFIEYENGKGKKELRDVEIGKRETALRRDFLKSFLPQFKEAVVDSVGDVFSIKLAGSVAMGIASLESDIDLQILPRSYASPYQKDLLITESLKALDILREKLGGEMTYAVDLWFENELDNL